MALLTAGEKTKVLRRIFNHQQFPGDVVKADMATEIDNIDTWVSTNPLAYNSQFTTGFKTSATADMKEFMLAAIMRIRSGG